MTTSKFDKIIIGAGLYGLYAALFCAKKGQSVLVLEADDAPFSRATYINQARVHNGYHYPRSLTTAIRSAGYFNRFCEDFGFCIHDSFEQVYATSARFSWTNAEQFKEFCKASGIPCTELPATRYFKDGMCDGAFLTKEYTYDAKILRDYFLDELKKFSGVEILYGIRVEEIAKDGSEYVLKIVKGQAGDMTEFRAAFVLNSTYASVNQILGKIKDDAGAADPTSSDPASFGRASLELDKGLFPLKYELCEIILCKASDELKNIGLTVMDGPFFSIMPFGKTGLHSLTSVTFTPHTVSFDDTPTFSCQKELRAKQAGTEGTGTSESHGCKEFSCTPGHLGNCNTCPMRPKTSFEYMSHLADKYIRPEYKYEYVESLFSMKPILKSSEVDDSRPTAIKVFSKEPTFVSVLSGKINTVYDLDEYLA